MVTTNMNIFRAAGLALALAGAGWAGATLADTHADAAGSGGTMQGMGHGQMMGGEQPGAMPGMEGGAPAAGEDADLDYARAMIGHHQSAIDMSRVLLEYGEDPELRQLAEQVIAAQQGEIDFLQNWLAKRGA